MPNPYLEAALREQDADRPAKKKAAKTSDAKTASTEKAAESADSTDNPPSTKES